MDASATAGSLLLVRYPEQLSLALPKAEQHTTPTAPGSRAAGEVQQLSPGAVVLRGFALPWAATLQQEVNRLWQLAPLRILDTPSGRMAVELTNCGEWGWTSDRTGYRYSATDPTTGRPWPAMPQAFLDLAQAAAAQAGLPPFVPDACLLNRYSAGTGMGLHQDKNERDFSQPIVSVSLGVSAMFLWGGAQRKQRPEKVPLHHGDVVVWSGAARLNYHGVQRVPRAEHEQWGPYRVNLTLRRAG